MLHPDYAQRLKKSVQFFRSISILVGDGEPIIIEDERAIFSFYFRNPDGNIVEARSGTDVSLEKWERLLALED